MNRTTATIKLSRQLKARIARLAKTTGKTPHAFMLDALERQTAREEQLQSFVQEALDSDRAIEDGEEVYAAEDVHAWLPRLARDPKAPRPKPWRG
jgi:predicted transcriptional regulator